jgi:hypothetical protein
MCKNLMYVLYTFRREDDVGGREDGVGGREDGVGGREFG